MGNNKITTSSQKKVNNSKRTNKTEQNHKIANTLPKKVNNSKRTDKTEQPHKGGALPDLKLCHKNHKVTNTLPKKVNNSKRTNKTEQNQIIKLNKKLRNQFGGDCGGPGCTDGDLGNLAGRFWDLGRDVVILMTDVVTTGEWMIVDMPRELVGAIENPSVNTPLSNII